MWISNPVHSNSVTIVKRLKGISSSPVFTSQALLQERQTDLRQWFFPCIFFPLFPSHSLAQAKNSEMKETFFLSQVNQLQNSLQQKRYYLTIRQEVIYLIRGLFWFSFCKALQNRRSQYSCRQGSEFSLNHTPTNSQSFACVYMYSVSSRLPVPTRQKPDRLVAFLLFSWQQSYFLAVFLD